ncbi:MAG: hypothetical protein OXI16_13670 [Chloroflexota bacterium]|nr:hypothetical protein [Chloroflexota bacterium]
MEHIKNIPPPEALDSEPRLMPDGSMDWHWFYEQVSVLQAWIRANICIECGKRKRRCGAVVCFTPECERIGITKRTGRCAFCGSRRNINASSGSPAMPLFIEWCDDCRGRKIPERDDAHGQSRMF